LAPNARYANIAEAYVADRIRKRLRRDIGRRGPVNLLGELYANADRYAEQVDAAVAAVFSERMTLWIETRDVATRPQRSVRIQYFLPVSSMVSSARIREVARIAT